MFSFSEGKAIGKIKGGPLDGNIIHIKDSTADKDSTSEDCECCGRCNPHKCSRKPCCRGCGIFGKDDEEEDIGPSILIKKGKVIPLPNIDIEKSHI